MATPHPLADRERLQKLDSSGSLVSSCSPDFTKQLFWQQQGKQLFTKLYQAAVFTKQTATQFPNTTGTIGIAITELGRGRFYVTSHCTD